MARDGSAYRMPAALVVALLASCAVHTHAACCAKNSGDLHSVRACGGAAFQGSEWVCRSDARCDWKSSCSSVQGPALRATQGGSGSAVDAKSGGSIGETGLVCVWFVGAAIFALCFEKPRRWALGMATFWPAGRNRSGRSFRHTLCGCCGCNANCWRATCCGLVMSTFNRAHLERRQWQWSDLCCALNPSVAHMNRQTIRHRLDVQPEPCMDCLTICCCLPCAVAQHTLEVEEGLPEPDVEVAQVKGVELAKVQP